MSDVYTECTVCNSTLTEEDIERNELEGNPVYSICLNCVKKGLNRTFVILKSHFADDEK